MPHPTTSQTLGEKKQPRTTDEFLTDEELAQLLGVTTRTTLRWRRDGGGPPYVRVGLRHVRYRRRDVDAWATRRTFVTLAAEAAA